MDMSGHKSFASPQIAKLANAIDTYLDITGLKEVTASHRIFRDSGQIRKLREGADMTVTRYNYAMGWLVDNWPADQMPPTLRNWEAEAKATTNPDYRVETESGDQVDKLSTLSDEALRERYLQENFGRDSDVTAENFAAVPAASHVHARDTREEDWITQQELHMQAVADNSGSMIEDAIELHAALVVEDDKLYTDDGKPLADKAALDASWRREIKAFRVLVRMQCRTSEEAQVKLRYFLRPAEPDEYSNMERLTLDAYVDEADKGTGCGNLTADFLQSLLVERV